MVLQLIAYEVRVHVRIVNHVKVQPQVFNNTTSILV